MIAAVLAARARLDAGFAAQDVEAVAAVSTRDPSQYARQSRRPPRDGARFLQGRPRDYESVDVTIGVGRAPRSRGHHGRGSGEAEGDRPNAGKTVRRRFTDVWRKGGRNGDTIRHATITAIE